MIAGLDELRGTSAEKVGALLAQVRSDGKASLALGVAERLPVVGETVRFLLYDVPSMDPATIDGMLDHLVDQIRHLRSDPAALDEPGGD